MTQVAGILWDMDGVLVDTGELHFKSWTITFSHYGFSYSRELFNETFGMTGAEMIKHAVGEAYTPETDQSIIQEKETIFRNSIHGVIELLPGVEELLHEFNRAHIPQAVASSAPQENVDAILDELEIRRHFQAIVSATNMPGKPDPSVFLAAAEALNAPPSGCIVIEDAIPGVEAARRAGMKCIAVTTTNIADKLRNADVVVDGLDELTLKDFKALIR